MVRGLSGDLPSLLALYLATIAVAIAVGLPAYARLLRRLKERHPKRLQAMGSPRLFDPSPRRGMALQKFIYSRGVRSRDPTLRRLCRFLALFVPVLLLTLGVEIFLLFRLFVP